MSQQCPFHTVSACPYTKETANGCPYIDHLANGIIEPPEHCVVAEAIKNAPPTPVLTPTEVVAQQGVAFKGSTTNLVQLILDRIGKR